MDDFIKSLLVLQNTLFLHNFSLSICLIGSILFHIQCKTERGESTIYQGEKILKLDEQVVAQLLLYQTVFR
jgi:hypothetical protein